MDIKKALSTASFFTFFLTSCSSAMLITVPERPVSSWHSAWDGKLIVVGKSPPAPLVLRLAKPGLLASASSVLAAQKDTPVACPSVMTHVNKTLAEQFNKAAPYLAICAFAVQCAHLFSRAQAQPQISPAVLAQLTPNERRLHALLQENEQLKKHLKGAAWQAVFSLAMLNPKFNESYEFLQNANDARKATDLLDPHRRASALAHLSNRFISKAKLFASTQLSKLLVSAYRWASPDTAHPSIKKSAIDLLAIASIYTVMAPQIVNFCTQPNGLVATMAREKALCAYNFLPVNLKYRLLTLKNWWNSFST